MKNLIQIGLLTVMLLDPRMIEVFDLPGNIVSEEEIQRAFEEQSTEGGEDDSSSTDEDEWLLA